MSVRVAVVGAGVHGAAAAFHLTRRGAEVTVIDRLGVAEGPTGRSSAVCRAFYTDPFLAEVAREALGMFADLDVADGAEAGFERTGALYLHGPDDLPELERIVAGLGRIDVDVAILDRQELGDRYPGLALGDLGAGVWEPGAGYADPVGTTRGLLRGARERGATLLIGREVVGIAPVRDQLELRLDDGTRLAVDRVLLATGPWTRAAAAMVGAELPLVAERHYVASVGWGDLPPVPFVLADLPEGYYAKPERGGQWLLGALHPEPEVDPDAYDPHIHESEQLRLVEAAVRRQPRLAEVEVRGGWASLYDISPDWQPVIGEIAPGVFVDAGSSGHGFKLAPALGRHVADLLVGAPCDPRLASFHPDRFARGDTVAAGFGEARIIG